jgi:hypothetical protein
MANTLDLFDTLNQLNKKNIDWFDELSLDEIKSIAPVVLMRWLSGTTNASQIIIINEILNPFVFTLANNKKLLWYLMCICTTGKHQKYNWSKINYGNAAQSLAIKCIKRYYNYSTRHATQVLPLTSNENIIDMAEELGYDTTELNNLKKELGYDVKISKPKQPKQSKKTDTESLNILDF